MSRPDPSATTPPVTPPIAISGINNGPSATEVQEGYDQRRSAKHPGRTVSIAGTNEAASSPSQLNSSFVSLLFGPTLYEAYGQIVLTLGASSFQRVKGVLFTYTNVPIAAVLPNGRIESRPVTICDYKSIATNDIKQLCAISTSSLQSSRRSRVTRCAVTGAVPFEGDNGSIGPQSFKAVELSSIAIKDVDDEVAVVEQYPM